MDWNSLLPSTKNPFQALENLGQGNDFLRGLTDLFILFIVCFGGVVIIGTFLWTIWSVFRTRSFFRGLPKLNEPERFNEIRRNWEDRHGHLAEDFGALLIEVPKVGEPLATDLRRCGNAAEVFNDSTLAHGIVGNRFLMAMPGILTGLGVLGTFVGLALGIGALEFEGKGVEELEGSITPLIQGSATAFMTSVWGVVASLVFTILEKSMEGLARWPIRLLQRRLNALVPRYLPEESMIQLQRSSQENESTLKGLAVAIGEQMQLAMDKIGESVTNAVREALGGQAQDLGKQSANLMSEALKQELAEMKSAITEMAEGFRTEFNGANSQLQSTVAGFDEILKALDGTVQTTRTSVEQAVGRLESQEQVVAAMGEAAQRLDEAAEKMTGMRDTFDLSSQRNAEAADAQKAATEGNQAVATQFSAIGEQLPEVRDTISEAARVIGTLGQPLLDLQRILEQTPEILENQATKQAKSDEERTAVLLGQTESLANAVAAAAEKFAEIKTLSESLNQSAVSLAEAGETLATFGSNVKNASDQQVAAAVASKNAAAAGERTAEKLSPIPESIANLAGLLEAAGSTIRTGAEAAKETYETLVEHQRVWFRGVEVGLSAMKDRLQELIDQYGEAVEGQTQEHMDRWVETVENSLNSFSVQVQALEGAANDLTEQLRQP